MKQSILKEITKYIARIFLIFIIINSIFYFGLKYRLNEANTPKIINDVNNMERFSNEYLFNKGFILNTFESLKKVIIFDFNNSYYGNTINIKEIYYTKILNSLYLFLTSIVFVYIVSFFILKKHIAKKTLNIFLVFMTRISLVLFSIVIIYFLSIKNHIFPIAGKVSPFFEELGLFAQLSDMFMHAFLPVFCLTLFFFSIFVMRLEKIKNIKEYSLKFLSDLRFIIPSILSIQLLIENIFLWPGSGMLFYNSLKTQDMPVLFVFSVYVPIFIFTINQIINFILRKYKYEV
ncbi:MAG: hypothetical protein M0R46_03225 [Candidatus Muirbacterium halophilum]|nr:hypothetical protein [Candidatus Muirbacterium halophilum]MCK9474900.1 hypothetical protein [Candidatus Muirbacterium halophilum]